MSSYFDQVEHELCAVLERGTHRPWHVRARRFARAHTFAVLLSSLVVATPAVGAVTNWFGFGAPDHFPTQSATENAGRPLAGSSEMLSLRVPDPRGGPAWGLRLVHTTRGDTCIQLGRVENGTLGSLGIDQAWNNDHLFHPFPNPSEGQDCGTADAVGNGFLNISRDGVTSSANPAVRATGPQAGSCASDEYIMFGPGASSRPVKSRSNIPTCPRGSSRLVFIGLLGPDTTSITYQAPNGEMRTERTSGTDGAYLLVFSQNFHTCKRYTQGPFGSSSPCGGGGVSETGASPNTTGAVKAITYRDGHSCNVDPSPALITAERAVNHEIDNLPHQGRLSGGRGLDPTAEKLFHAFGAKEHLKPNPAGGYQLGCPPVGYVVTREKRVTAAMVATPITVHHLPNQADNITMDITFTAREPVSASSSWYEDLITNPASCPSSSQGGKIEFGNIRPQTEIHDKRLVGRCKGTYHGVIGYMQNSGPIDQNSGGGTPGQDGSVIVGRFSFTTH